MTASSKPAVVLVHGAWHQPAHYETLVHQLQKAEFEVFLPHLPSCQPDHQPSASLHDDVEIVRDQVRSLADNGRDVIMLMHSYGGAVGSEAIKGLSKAERNGQPGGVVYLVYMCAFMLQAGQSTGDIAFPRPDPDPVIVDEAHGTTYPGGVPPVHLFYNDLDPDLAAKMEALLVPQAAGGLIVAINHDPWRMIPTVYLRAELDNVLYPHWQQKQIDAVRAAGANIKVESYQSSHSPFVSMPEEMVKAVERCCI